MRGGERVWPEEATMLLRKLWAKGFSADQISRAIDSAKILEINGVFEFRPTRNSVIGHARRDPLCKPRPSPIKRKRGTE